MRTGVAAGHRGFFHQSAFYGSDEEFLAVVTPFLADGLGAGEPTVVAFSPANEALIRAAFGNDSGLTYLEGEAQYQRPAGAIRGYREIMANLVARGATQIRIVGDVPHPGLGVPWEWWARYEALVNHAFAEFPLWGLCPYDTRTAPPEVLDQVRRTHPHLATPHGSLANPAFEDPREFLNRITPRWHDPLELTRPLFELRDPPAAAARDAVTQAGRATELSGADISGLVLAATEAITNAVLHGRPPVRVRIWAQPRRVVVAVTDHGTGPDNPFVGLIPARESDDGVGGLGLWLAHQMCSYVSLNRDSDGFTVRLIAETPHPQQSADGAHSGTG
ncbi:anti-sigma regulatory factor [Rhizocola hellebori]|uniref:Anti-sigma regulatory factor n=1 Tax=Rhizocola hellebori TaxID=1392758 RepID=A0A8J3Q1G7_9ACTN|nr:sensor histidine kinase [Rhizocola hellebori]GIH02010.1 anti-sigma regulatory factor [Rhizocola hellebori]